jgi:hypothetical protein
MLFFVNFLCFQVPTNQCLLVFRVSEPASRNNLFSEPRQHRVRFQECQHNIRNILRGVWTCVDARFKMKVELYNEILKEIKSFTGPGRTCTKYLQEKFPRYGIRRNHVSYVVS